MPKRPYRAKVKGCYECSQRRLNCDRGVPECRKCITKGLKCSGLGVRHRFSSGVASRGHCIGKTMEEAYPQALQVCYDLPILWDSSDGYDAFSSPDMESHPVNLFDTGNIFPPFGDGSFTPNGALILPPPHPDHVPAWKRRLLLHFSENIAGEMIACDGPHNGWRRFVLPMADRDELVMDAVLAVSLFHRPQAPHDQPATDRPEQDHYARAIQGLQKRSQLGDCDRPDQHSILLTILLLLTAVMVNGSSDFPILFNMLQSAIDAIGGDMRLGSGGIAEFLVRQIRKLKVYAAPLLSEDAGINIISSEAEVDKMFECLNHCVQNNPQHSKSLELVPGLVRQACEIYLNQVAFDSHTPVTPQVRARRVVESIRRVQRFIDTFEAFPENAPGKQNLTMGLGTLRKIWARKPDERWTVLLPQPKIFVM
ncbi:Acriflavine sensitivity control protein acr-2 [Fusarium oxysporum f. sp. cubense race 1]|uniref:Acriflavine sensitivity control protein acr-2 n=1 Tax=Fusarium oxysporum f. sp. cubense (strain race 1) TaxID=1229664 RepID=N4UFS9_FUSC1|nr:Acriflavine sensitivity control protein acr-2 [Fusarium oxysporum f. sp. cubense race 1]